MQTTFITAALVAYTQALTLSQEVQAATPLVDIQSAATCNVLKEYCMNGKTPMANMAARCELTCSTVKKDPAFAARETKIKAEAAALVATMPKLFDLKDIYPASKCSYYAEEGYC